MDFNVIIAVAVTAAVGMIACYVIYRRYKRTMGKVTFLFNAIDNLDFAFNFPEEGRDKLVNESLNHIRRILERARHDAMERERYYEQIMNTVSTGIMVVDERGSILQHNEAALSLLGVEVLAFYNNVEQRLASDDFARHETTAVIDGRKVRIIAFSDIRNELSQREVESWTKLIRVLTHEIMNNIAPITSISDTLSRQTTDGETREGLEVINSTCRQLMQFVENYRRLTLIPEPQPKLFYARPFLERMVTLAKTYGEAGVTLDIQDELLIYADESLIAHVVTNILKNAIEAGAHHITVHAYTTPDDAIIIDIANDGTPIAADVAQQVFVPFFTTKPSGSGIGLSVSRNIMRQSGGSVELIPAATTLFRLKF